MRKSYKLLSCLLAAGLLFAFLLPSAGAVVNLSLGNLVNSNVYTATVSAMSVKVGGQAIDAVKQEDGSWLFTLPAGTNAAKLIVNLTMPEGTVSKPYSGTQVDLSNAFTYEITSRDGLKSSVTVSAVVEPAIPAIVTTTKTISSYTRVYKSADLKAVHMAHLQKGDKVELIEVTGDWAKILWENTADVTPGYVPAKLLK